MDQVELMARHVIVRGKSEVVAVGALFTESEAEAASLVSSGAAVFVKSRPVLPLKVASKAKPKGFKEPDLGDVE